MKSMLFLSLLLMASSSCWGLDLDKLPAHPADEATSCSWRQRLTLKNALDYTREVKSWLTKFDELAETLPEEMPAEKIKKMNLPKWVTHALEFYNATIVIQGTLLRQNYEIKRLEYELAQERAKHQKDGVSEVNEKKKALAQAEADFMKYWDEDYSVYD